MPLRAIKKPFQCCQLPCLSDAYFADGNIPTIITTEYEDQCGCRIFCSYPNNFYAIVVAQLLTLVSFAITLDAASDCHFVNGPASEIDPFSTTYLQLINKTIPEEDLRKNEKTERGLGFFGWEYLDGTCASGGHRVTNATAIASGASELYFFDLVGTDWRTPRVMAVISLSLSVIVMLWTLSFSCVATKRRYRAILSFLLILVLPLFQSLTFLVLRTDFCEEFECTLGGTGQRVIAAILASVFAGILLCVGTTNFPGNPYTKGKRSQRCSNLLFCRNTCRQLVMDQNAEPEQNSMEMVATTNQVDVVEVPVESEFFDVALVDGTAVPDTPAPVEISVASLVPSPSVDTALAVPSSKAV
jgi:hypothetical protein